MDLDDAALVARVVANDDRHAFSQLVRRHQSMVRGHLRRLTGGDEHLADDLAQEAFLRGYRGIGGFRGQAKFSSWMVRIATNVYLSHRRRHAVPYACETDIADPTAESAAGRSVFRHDLERAMTTLPETERIALSLAYADDATHEDIASIMQMPVGTVKSAILRAKEKLRKKLRAWAPVPS